MADVFGQHEVHIYFDDGRAERGYQPSIDPSGRTLTYAPSADEPASKTVNLSNTKMLRFAARPNTPPLPERFLVDGCDITATYTDGNTLVGRIRAVPIPGGVWIHAHGEAPDALLFLPHGAAPSLEIRPQTDSEAPANRGDGDQRISDNPFEASTVLEMDAVPRNPDLG